MAKAFSILHRAAALLVALCLLVGMALPVYAAGDESLFFGADSETIPDESSTTVAETSQDPAATGLESVSPKVDTVSETNGTSPAGDGSAPPSDTQDQEETVLPEDAPNTDEEPTAEDEPMMLADDFSADDGAGEPAAIAETGAAASQGFIPFKKAVESPNLFVKVDNAMTAAGKTPVAWNFSTMPSENWKNGVGSALTAYAAGTGTWDAVVTAFVDGWATEAALNAAA